MVQVGGARLFARVFHSRGLGMAVFERPEGLEALFVSLSAGSMGVSALFISGRVSGGGFMDYHEKAGAGVWNRPGDGDSPGHAVLPFPAYAEYSGAGFPGVPGSAQRVLGSVGNPVVRPDGRGYAVRGDYGDAVVRNPGYGQRHAERAAHLCPCGAHHGSRTHLLPDSCDASRFRPVCGERNEAGMGFCLALPDGCGNFCSHPDRVRIGPAAAFRPRTERDEPGRRHHVRDCGDWATVRQDSVFSSGTVSAPPLGDRTETRRGAAERSGDMVPVICRKNPAPF